MRFCLPKSPLDGILVHADVRPEVDVLLSVVECFLVGEEVVDALVPSHLSGTRPAEVSEHDEQHP